MITLMTPDSHSPSRMLVCESASISYPSQQDDAGEASFLPHSTSYPSSSTSSRNPNPNPNCPPYSRFIYPSMGQPPPYITINSTCRYLNRCVYMFTTPPPPLQEQQRGDVVAMPRLTSVSLSAVYETSERSLHWPRRGGL